MNIRNVILTCWERKALLLAQFVAILIGLLGAGTLFRHYPHFTIKVLVEMGIVVVTTSWVIDRLVVIAEKRTLSKKIPVESSYQ